jgi:hypothetical protein
MLTALVYVNRILINIFRPGLEKIGELQVNWRLFWNQFLLLHVNTTNSRVARSQWPWDSRMMLHQINYQAKEL